MPRPDASNDAPKITFQGEPGAFSDEAIRSTFQDRAIPLPCRDFDTAVRRVAEGEARFGMIPVENSLAGTVTPAYDALLAHPVRIVGEVARPIRHTLMAPPGARVEDIRQVRSHPVALAQCTEFLRRRSDIEAIAVHDTAGAARDVAERGNPEIGAIAPAGAATRYGLETLATDLQDRDDNRTRFYIIRREAHVPPEAEVPLEPGSSETVPHRKWVVIVDLEDEVGALHRVLGPLAGAGLNLTKIESRPGPRPWSYRFILEFRDGGGPETASGVLRTVGAGAATCRVLGAFATGRAAVNLLATHPRSD